jgi:hypothetical protein
VHRGFEPPGTSNTHSAVEVKHDSQPDDVCSSDPGRQSAVEAAELSTADLSISESIEREANRLSQSQPKPTPQDARWARVRSLKPGTEILLSTRGTSSARRYFLSADQAVLNVLDLSSVPLSGDPIDRLLRMASARPEVFVTASTSLPTVDGPLEIQSGSVFYKGRMIASIARLVETVFRADVTAVERPSEGSVSAGTAAVIGALVAAIAGATIVYASGASRDISPGGVGVLIFAPIGAGVGFLAGSLAESNSKRPVVIYRP